MEAGFLLYVLYSACISWYIFSTLFTIFWPIKSTLYSVFYSLNPSGRFQEKLLHLKQYLNGPFGQKYFANVTVASLPCRLGTSLRRLMDLPWTQKAAFSCRCIWLQVLLMHVLLMAGTFYSRFFWWQVLLMEATFDLNVHMPLSDFHYLTLFMWAGGDWELAFNVGHDSPLGSPKTCPGQQNFGQSTSWSSPADSFFPRLL